MQPVILKIQGNFYDSQIYRGKLYLWHFDGRLSVYDWNQLIYNIDVPDYVAFVKELCLLDGSYLYKTYLYDRLLNDKEIKNIVEDKIRRLSGLQFIINEEELAKYVIKEYDVPLGEMPLDVHIYNKKLYYTLDNGQYVSQLKGNKEPLSALKRPNKIFDGRVVHMAVNNGRMAMSMLSDGLYERNVADYFEEREPRQISNRHSSFAYYNYSNLFNTSLQGESFLIYNSPLMNDDVMDFGKQFARQRINRVNAILYDENSITQKGNLGNIGWGFNNRIYYSNGKQITAVQYSGYKRDCIFKILKDNVFIEQAPSEKIVSAAVAYFGNIVEYMSKLVVLQSDGDIFQILGPVTRWRVFPRSLNYENHLHVILDDCLCVYGFMHDYTSNDRDKTMGAYYVNRQY